MRRHRPHYAGTYPARARRLVAAATADTATVCGRCGLRLDQHAPHRNGRPAFWTAGHVTDSQVDGPLRPGHPRALSILGYGGSVKFTVSNVHVDKSLKPKKFVRISFDLTNASARPGNFLVDFRIHYRKANGATAAKVFKLSERLLPPREKQTFHKNVSLENMTTRKHYPGRHNVEALINGQVVTLGSFDI
jgi:hypothetical protein